MIRSEQERMRIVRAWLDEGSAELSQRVLDGVLIEVSTTPQDRPFGARWSPRMSTSAKLAVATAVVVVAFIAGTRLAPGGGPGGPGPAVSPSPSAIPSPTSGSIDYSYRDVGFIGLPPPGATPSSPTSGELVESFWLPPVPGRAGYHGGAFLYADGRLIWLEHYDGVSTGYLEQRLSPEGVELAQALLATVPFDSTRGVKRLDPRQLPDLLPANAWADITIRPYVPSGFAACLVVDDNDPFQVGSLVLTTSEMLAILPAAAADLLRARDAVPSGDDPSDCLGMTTAEARQLDGALRGAGLAQDESRNRYLLEYHILLDSAAPDGWRLGVWFEPILPDGTIGCPSCG